MSKMDEYIDRVRHLPPAPAVVGQLLGLLSDPNRNLERIVELIGYDPSLTAEVLKRCNSAFFRGAEPASDIFEAVSRLGFYEVYCVVVALMAARTISLAPAKGALDPNVLWKHSVTTAVAASALAVRVQEPEAVAFTAGLLHDVGKLILASVEPQVYSNLLAQSGSSGPALAGAEAAALGVTHADVGSRLLARWGLPTPVAIAVQYHHQPPTAASPYERLAAIVHLSNILAHHTTQGDGAPLDPATLRPELLKLTDVEPDDLPYMLGQTKSGLVRVEGLLQLTG